MLCKFNYNSDVLVNYTINNPHVMCYRFNLCKNKNVFEYLITIELGAPYCVGEVVNFPDD